MGIEECLAIIDISYRQGARRSELRICLGQVDHCVTQLGNIIGAFNCDAHGLGVRATLAIADSHYKFLLRRFTLGKRFEALLFFSTELIGPGDVATSTIAGCISCH